MQGAYLSGLKAAWDVHNTNMNSLEDYQPCGASHATALWWIVYVTFILNIAQSY